MVGRKLLAIFYLRQYKKIVEKKLIDRPHASLRPRPHGCHHQRPARICTGHGCWRAPRAHTATLATVARGAATKRVEKEDEEEEKRQAELCSAGDSRLAQRLQVALGCRCTQRMELETFPLEAGAS